MLFPPQAIADIVKEPILSDIIPGVAGSPVLPNWPLLLAPQE